MAPPCDAAGRVAAGAIAEKYLKLAYGVEIVAFVSSVGKIHMPTSSTEEEALDEDYLKLLKTVTREDVDRTLIRCPHEETAKLMEDVRSEISPEFSFLSQKLIGDVFYLYQRVRLALQNDDSIGGTVTCVIRGAPEGLGEPVFDKLEALLAHAMLSIPATKGFEIGSGFAGTELAGSKHNDAFVRRADGGLGTKTNKSGGIQGGISNGEDVYFK